MKKTIYTLLALSLILGTSALLSACLDIPSDPSSSKKKCEVDIFVLQEGNGDSTSFKVISIKRASLVAHVTPSKFEKELVYSWYEDDELISEENPYLINDPLLDWIPNRLVVSDNEGNTIEKSFNLVINTPPRLGTTIYPSDQAVFVQSPSQPISFQWYVWDQDEDKVTSILTIDGKDYNVGELTQLTQSGFEKGKHTYTVTAIDEHGYKESSSKRTFYIDDPEVEDP